MPYNPNAPADDEFLADFPAEQREQQRAILEDQIVDADKLRGRSPGNLSDNIPINNGTLNVNLNADQLDGKEAVEFADATHTHSAATTNANGFMSNTDKSKLDGISSGAEVNQNAFANVKVGSTTIQADAKQDTLELTAGTNITLTPDATNDKVTIAAPNVLPLSGGTLTGNLTINKSAPAYYLKDTTVIRNTAPSADIGQSINIVDKNGANLAQVQNIYRTTKENLIRIIAYKGTTTDSTWTALSVGYDSSGNAFTYAPTPAAGNNSTQIATTAWVTTKVGNYLPLSGGTMTGTFKALGIFGTNSSGYLALYGGSSGTSANGAMLELGSSGGGTSWDSTSGSFALGATSKALIGKPNGTLTWGGKNVLTDATVGTIVSQSNTTSQSIAASTSKNLTSKSLAAGTWVVTARGEYTGCTAGKNYGLMIGMQSATFSYQTNSSVFCAAGGDRICLSTTRILELSSATTVYVIGRGATAFTMDSSELHAVRIK